MNKSHFKMQKSKSLIHLWIQICRKHIKKNFDLLNETWRSTPWCWNINMKNVATKDICDTYVNSTFTLCLGLMVMFNCLFDNILTNWQKWKHHQIGKIGNNHKSILYVYEFHGLLTQIFGMYPLASMDLCLCKYVQWYK
jgi:hypothetical protein